MNWGACSASPTDAMVGAWRAPLSRPRWTTSVRESQTIQTVAALPEARRLTSVSSSSNAASATRIRRRAVPDARLPAAPLDRRAHDRVGGAQSADEPERRASAYHQLGVALPPRRSSPPRSLDSVGGMKPSRAAIQYAEMAGTAKSASRIPTPWIRVMRSRSTTAANRTVAAG